MNRFDVISYPVIPIFWINSFHCYMKTVFSSYTYILCYIFFIKLTLEENGKINTFTIFFLIKQKEGHLGQICSLMLAWCLDILTLYFCLSVALCWVVLALYTYISVWPLLYCIVIGFCLAFMFVFYLCFCALL